jgi:glucans biosynthesis protein
LVSRQSSGNVTIGVSIVLLTFPAALLTGLLSLSASRNATPQPEHVTIVDAKPQRFDPSQVIELARRLSTEAPRAAASVTPGLEELSYVQYRGIRPRIDRVWADDRSPFRVDVLPAGFVYKSPVVVSVIEDGFAHDLGSDANSFDLGDDVPASLRGKPLSLSGFRLRTRLNSSKKWDEFLVFQGASYFRAVGQGQWYGLSARGLALRTGEPEGEEFPAFTHFWLEKPANDAKSVVVHALLESASVTGAYRFIVTPGQSTVMDVQYTLFPRVDLKNVGIAPLTSMFLFDNSNHSRFEDFRQRVHDSDGLMFTARHGEQVWRHLANPKALQFSSFTANQPRAFGLMQRASKLSEFQDFEAHYEMRPSAWVEFGEGGAPGALRLVEIPTPNETNDNIVAFWSPRDTLPANVPYSGTYRLSWTAESLVPRSLGRFVATRLGHTTGGERKLFVLDLAGAGIDPQNLSLQITSSAGEVFHPTVQYNPVVRGLRASFEFDPRGAPLSEFRAVVVKNGKPVSETWLYRWTG